MKKTIWYKNYLGEWTKSPLPATEKNFKIVQKAVALNGVAEIFKNLSPN
jgi:hypothetical protein